MMRKVLLAGAATIIALATATTSAGAGIAAQMTATPNPVTVGSQFTVSNVAGSANTCEEGGVVEIAIFEVEGDEPISTETVLPDSDGNWSTAGTASVVGSYVIEAACVGEEDEVLDGMGPQASPDFVYAPVPFQVVPVPTTTTSTTTTTTVPDEPVVAPPVAEATVVIPTFTG
jgi:hypothetical protein